MRGSYTVAALAAITAMTLAGPASAGAVLEGPPQRALTSAASVISERQDGAAAVPIPDLFYARGGMDAVWTRDGRGVIISTNLTGRYNLWLAPAAGGFPRQLTQSDDRQSGLATSPDGRTVVYQADHAGGEIYQLYALPLQGGSPVALADAADVSDTHAIFAPDSLSIAFDRRPRSAPSTDVAVMDIASRRVRVLTHEAAPDEAWSVVAYAKDGRHLIANRANFAGTRGAAWMIDVVTGAAVQLTTGAFDVASDMSPDGRYVAITSEQADGARKVALLEVGTGRSRLLDADPWEQSAGRFAPDGKTLIYARNVDGRRGLMAYDLANGVARPVVDAAGVSGEASETQTSVSPDGRSLLFSHQASNAPFDYWIADLASGKATQLTQLSLASIAPARLPAARIVHYASADGTVISALLWTPFNLARDHAAPAIVLPHGGPTGQTLDTFDRTAVALASRGYMVIAPNPRGSTGYGRAFEEANRKDLGGGDLEDEVAGAKFMVDTGYVDPRRLGITGGSYGGYMTLMAAAKTPDLWAAAVEEYGIIDWFAMYASEAPTLQQYQKGLIGDPVTDKAVYQAASPLTYVHALRAPLLVLQGDNDIRVPKGQALEVIGLLKADGRTVDSHFYPNEGHGFVKRENQIDALERTVAWFDTYLKGPRS